MVRSFGIAAPLALGACVLAYGIARGDTARTRAPSGHLRAESWAAGGRLIVYRKRDELWTMFANGSHRRRVSRDPDAAVSPSGRFVARVTEDGVVVRTLDGRLFARSRLPYRSSDVYLGPVWDPLDRYVAVAVDRETPTKNTLRVAIATVGDGARILPGWAYGDARWSPDGQRFSVTTPPAKGCCSNSLVIMRRDASTWIKLLRGVPSNAAWAPSGQSFAYARGFGPELPRRTDPPAQRIAIYVINVDGSGRRRIATTPPMQRLLFDYPVAWSPDGRQIAFADVRGILVANVDGSGLRRVSRLGNGSQVAWTPASSILFDHNGVIYTVVPGSAPVRIAG